MSAPTLRLDKWLWYARFAKSRALAQKLIANGQVAVNGAPARKTSAQVAAGDRLAVVIGAVRRSVVVRDVGERRGPAAEARALYEEPQPPERLSWEDAGAPLRPRRSRR